MSTRPLQNILTPVIAGLYPGYFAFVMATGIISIAAYLLEMLPAGQYLELRKPL